MLVPRALPYASSPMPSSRRALFALAPLVALAGCNPTPEPQVAPRPEVSACSLEVWAGAYSTCTILRSGAIYCWGANQAGQLGLGDRTERVHAPARLERLAGPLVDVALGPNHGCALHADGGLFCWGSNQAGQLGVSAVTTRPVPARVEGLARLTGITVGNTHSCAVDEAGAVWCWGGGELGQLGQGKKSSSTPTRVPGLAGIKAIAGGDDFVCALSREGQVSCWGAGERGQLGDGQRPGEKCLATFCRAEPKPVGDVGGAVAAIVAGHDHACALRGDGEVKCWGSNTRGQAGDGESGGARMHPVNVIGLPRVEQLFSGGNHTCAATKDADLWCWGSNHNAQIDGSGADQLPPVQVVAAPSGPKKVSLGRAHTCVRSVDGRLLCWGRNNFGQLGLPNVPTKTGRPTAVPLACD